MEEVHVVFGATGAIGSAIVRELISQGEFVRAVVRNPAEAKDMLPEGAGIVAGDLLDPDSTAAASRGATVIYDCANVRYSKWAETLPAMRANALAAARKASARLVYTDNVYAYGPLPDHPVSEDYPRAATTRKGALRAEFERTLLEAHRRGDVRVVIPRYPDFYGPFVLNPLIRPMFEAALTGKTATWPVNLDSPHDLVYINDAARAAVLLASREDAFGQVWHVPGPEPITGRRFLESIFAAAGTKKRIRAVSPRMFRLFGVFIPDAREMVEMLYQFQRPLLLDGSKFAAEFPQYRYTSHAEAVHRTVEWYREMSGE